jgi:hypothetical protein
MKERLIKAAMVRLAVALQAIGLDRVTITVETPDEQYILVEVGNAEDER